MHPLGPSQKLLDDYLALAKKDGEPIYLAISAGRWVAWNYLSEHRDDTTYYFIHPSGSITFGADAQEQFEQERFKASEREQSRRWNKSSNKPHR